MTAGNASLPRPLIVCGLPRAGTRMMADILNQHPQVCIQDEVRTPVIRAALAFLATVDEVYERQLPESTEPRLSGGAKWRSNKKGLMFSVWQYGGKRAPLYKPGVRYAGYKTPLHEEFFDAYSAIFGVDKLRVVHCVRRFVPCYLSIAGMRWWRGRRIRNFARLYVNSLRAFERIQDRAPDSIRMIRLEDLASAQDPAAFVQRNVFDWLQLKEPPNLRALIEALPNRNSSQSVGAAKRGSLTAEEEQAIRKFPVLREIEAKYFADLM